MKLVIDTCAYTAFQRGDRRMLELFNTYEELFFPSIVLGELNYGFMYGSKYEENARRLSSFMEQAGIEIVNIDRDIAFRYGLIASQLRQAGKKIPQNDIWIAACCMERGAHLATLDSDFSFVPGLIVRPLS